MESGDAFDLATLRSVVRRFVEKEMPRELAQQWDDEGRFPREVFDKLVELGVTGLTVSEEFGGLGRNITGSMIVIEELARRSMAVAIPYIMSACYAGMNLEDCASIEQKAELLPRAAAGKLMFAYGWTEPNAGGDLASVSTRAERRGDRIVVNGAKRFCSGARIADYIYTLVRTGEKEQRHHNLSLLLIPPSTPGITIDSIESLGIKGVGTTDVTFKDVEVPVRAVMGGESGWNRGWSMIMGAGLDVEKLEVAALSVGVAQAALEDAWAYAWERHQFDKPIAQFQSIQHKLAEMKTRLHAARLMLYHASALADRRAPCAVETSMVKLFCGEAARELAIECQTIMGAYGYVKGMDCERYVRDAMIMPIMGGSSAIQKNNIFKWSDATRGGVVMNGD